MRRPLASLAFAGLVACAPAPAMPPSSPHPLLGAEAPPVGLSALDDPPPALVVDFWASWCEACRDTMPALAALFRDHRDAGLVVVGVSEDDDPRVATQAARALGASFPIVHDRGRELLARYRVGRLPTTFVIDAAGAVRWVGRDPAGVRAVAEALLRAGGRP